MSEYAINNKWICHLYCENCYAKLYCENCYAKEMKYIYKVANGNDNKMANEQDSKWWLSNMPSIQSVSKYAINDEYICHLQFQNKYANKVSCYAKRMNMANKNIRATCSVWVINMANENMHTTYSVWGIMAMAIWNKQ